jgi:hypothetical protein
VTARNMLPAVSNRIRRARRSSPASSVHQVAPERNSSRVSSGDSGSSRTARPGTVPATEARSASSSGGPARALLGVVMMRRSGSFSSSRIPPCSAPILAPSANCASSIARTKGASSARDCMSAPTADATSARSLGGRGVVRSASSGTRAASRASAAGSVAAIPGARARPVRMRARSVLQGAS